MSAHPLIDRDHLDAQTFGDADLAREVLNLFAGQCRRLVPAIGKADRPSGERADLAHTLKGAALGVGAARVAAASAALEEDFRTHGRAAAPAELLAELEAAAADTLTLIEGQIGAGAAGT